MSQLKMVTMFVVFCIILELMDAKPVEPKIRSVVDKEDENFPRMFYPAHKFGEDDFVQPTYLTQFFNADVMPNEKQKFYPVNIRDEIIFPENVIPNNARNFDIDEVKNSKIFAPFLTEYENDMFELEKQGYAKVSGCQ